MAELTKREKQVCDLIVHGLSNKDIGRALAISIRTVEEHRKGIFEKMKVRNAVELTRAVYGIKEFGPKAEVTHDDPLLAV